MNNRQRTYDRRGVEFLLYTLNMDDTSGKPRFSHAMVDPMRSVAGPGFPVLRNRITFADAATMGNVLEREMGKLPRGRRKHCQECGGEMARINTVGKRYYMRCRVCGKGGAL